MLFCCCFGFIARNNGWRSSASLPATYLVSSWIGNDDNGGDYDNDDYSDDDYNDDGGVALLIDDVSSCATIVVFL